MILARHGESDYIEVAGSPDLNEKGIQQAMQLGDQLRGRGIETIYTSPADRCRYYAQIVGERLKLGVIVDSRLADFSTGRISEMKERFAGIRGRGERIYDLYNRGELDYMRGLVIPRYEIKARMQGFLSEFAGRNILAVTHLEGIQSVLGVCSKGQYINC